MTTVNIDGVTRVLTSVSTAQLRQGDTVWNQGMLTVLGSLRTYEHDGRTVYAFAGTVTNREELTEPGGFRAVWPLTGLLCTRGPDAWQWTIQGNGYARWLRVEPV